MTALKKSFLFINIVTESFNFKLEHIIFNDCRAKSNENSFFANKKQNLVKKKCSNGSRQR